MNDMLKTMMERRSVRKYKPDVVPQELIDQVIEAGLYAASGHGNQSPIILAVTNKEIRDHFSAANAKILGNEDIDPFYGAPVVLIVLADKSYPTYVYDGSLVMGNMMLMAESLGLGSCWIHRAKEEFDSVGGKAFLTLHGIEGDYEGIGHCILGYPDTEKTPPPPRKDHRVYYIK